MATLILTGGFGFIGSNLAHALHAQGFSLVIVDHLESGNKFANSAGLPLLDYCDKHSFLEKFAQAHWGKIAAVLHQGACSSTIERNGRYMMENNYHYSRTLMALCQAQNIPLLYASSAATYGLAEICREEEDRLPQFQPLNVYGYSKWLFDQHVRRFWENRQKKRNTAPIIGLRYFNVYGPRESHKGRMASVVFHLYHQQQQNEPMKLFEGFDGYPAGEQKRDFIYVDDAVAVNIFFLQAILEGKDKSGIYNCGSGVARPFNDIPRALSQCHQSLSTAPLATTLQQNGKLAYIPFPDDLKGRYQSYTQADLRQLRAAGFEGAFVDIFEGVRRYWQFLSA